MTKLQDATDDELITELENRGRINKYHTVEIRLADFSMKHTMRCQPDLFNCTVHRYIEDQFVNNRGLSPIAEGIYTIREIKGKFKLTLKKGD